MNSIITLDEARGYLRVDYTDEDTVIDALIGAAQELCRNIARLSEDSWNEIANSETDMRKEILRVATLYTLGYLFEHREEANHHDLNLTLRNLLFAIREGL